MDSNTLPVESHHRVANIDRHANKPCHHISRTFLVFSCVGFLVIMGHFYTEAMKKPADMPQRFKVTMIDRMSLLVLQTAKMCESFGLGHQLNVTRGLFESATGMMYRFDDSLITKSIACIVTSVARFVANACDTLHLDFCSTKTAEISEDLPNGDAVTTLDDVFAGVPVRLYRDHSVSVSETTPKPAIIYVHGAVVMGSIDVWDSFLRMYAASTNAIIVYIEYRWAPENKFPAPLDDCMTVTRWILQNADHYGIDPKSVAIQGDSAGAVIASVVAQTIAAEHQNNTDNPELKMLILMMPLLQGLDLNLPSYQNNEAIFSGILSRLLVAKFWIWYMGLNSDDLVTAILQGRHIPAEFRQSDRFQKIIGHDLIPDAFRTDTLNPARNCSEPENTNVVNTLSSFFLNPKFSPLMEENISPHHPHTLIITSGLDILRDDGLIYANRLRRAGTNVWWRHYEKGFHSCNAYWQGMLKIDIGYQILKETIDLVTTYLHEPRTTYLHEPLDRSYS